MRDYAAHSVVVDAEFDNSGSSGPTTYERVFFLAIDFTDGPKHVWFDGEHYTVDGVADEVSEGDLFYTSDPEEMIWKVRKIDDSASSDDAMVTIDVLYGPSYEPTESASQALSDQVRYDVLTGNYDMPMGDPGPPRVLNRAD